MRILALGGVAGPILFITVVILCAALRPKYDHATQFISELGATGTPYASLMNFGGFIPSGLLLASFGVSLASLVPCGLRSTVAAGLITVFGVGIVVAGVFSCDPGCPHQEATIEATIHDRVAIASFLAAIAGSGLFAYCFRGLTAWRSLWLYSALSSAAALAFLLALASSLESRTGTGLWQRLLIGTLYLWCAVVGLRAFRQRHAALNHPQHFGEDARGDRDGAELPCVGHE